MKIQLSVSPLRHGARAHSCTSETQNNSYSDRGNNRYVIRQTEGNSTYAIRQTVGNIVVCWSIQTTLLVGTESE
jgi:hypothetical protein